MALRSFPVPLCSLTSTYAAPLQLLATARTTCSMKCPRDLALFSRHYFVYVYICKYSFSDAKLLPLIHCHIIIFQVLHDERPLILILFPYRPCLFRCSLWRRILTAHTSQDLGDAAISTKFGLSSGRRLISRTELVNMPARNISVGARIAAIWWLVVVVTLQVTIRAILIGTLLYFFLISYFLFLFALHEERENSGLATRKVG